MANMVSETLLAGISTLHQRENIQIATGANTVKQPKLLQSTPTKQSNEEKSSW